MLFNFGLDWLTLTNVINDGSGVPPLMPVFQDLTRVTTKWGAGGYQGKQDKDMGLKYGSRLRKDGRADEMLIATGYNASKLVDAIPDPTRYRVTRVDIQTTVQFLEPRPYLARVLYGEIKEAKAKGESITKRRKVVLVQSETGETLYLGSRKTGRKFFRLYDKSDDVGLGLGRVWRQEVQYGRDLAQEALERYLNIHDNPGAIISLVCAEFQDAMGYSLINHVKQEPEVVSGTAKPETTLEKKLKWLETCVKPTIALMIYEDLEKEMLTALGLR